MPKRKKREDPDYLDAEQWRADLRRVRKSLGLTQRQLAEIAGISVTHYGTIESGNDNLTLRVLARVAPVLFGKTLEELVLGEPPSTGSNRATQGHVNSSGEFSGVSETAIRFALHVHDDVPDLGLQAGDVMVVDPDESPSEGCLVAVRGHDGVCRLHLVRSLDPSGELPLIMSQAQAPDVVFSDRFHKLLGTVTHLDRKKPRFDS